MKRRGRAAPAPALPLTPDGATPTRTLATVTAGENLERHTGDMLRLADGRTVRLSWSRMFGGQLDGWFARVLEGDRYGEPVWLPAAIGVVEVIESPNLRPRATDDSGAEVDPLRAGSAQATLV